MKFCTLTEALIGVAYYTEKSIAHAQDPDVKEFYETVWFLLHAIGRGESEEAHMAVEALISRLYAHEIEANANDA
jgi:hypothetical protein